MTIKRIRLALKPVTPIWPKCRRCLHFRHNFGDSLCDHKGYWFEAWHMDTGEKVNRKLITYHKIAYCRTMTEKYPQTEILVKK